ncbi:MAG: ClpXP protease specificity-enhancing factor SspB [Pseudomonadota bacterium]
MTRSIDYGKLMHRAMRGLIKEVLEDVRDNGLPGAHHFFITFETVHPEARLADWLRERYPSEMTVVMQHWFNDLEITYDGFSVTLNFGDNPENLYIPYDAIQTFVDPSVEFGLRFEPQEEEEEKEDTAEDAITPAEPAAAPENASQEDAEVVTLDHFRK